MALTVKGARLITVDGAVYRWLTMRGKSLASDLDAIGNNFRICQL